MSVSFASFSDPLEDGEIVLDILYKLIKLDKWFLANHWKKLVSFFQHKNGIWSK